MAVSSAYTSRLFARGASSAYATKSRRFIGSATQRTKQSVVITDVAGWAEQDVQETPAELTWLGNARWGPIPF